MIPIPLLLILFLPSQQDVADGVSSADVEVRYRPVVGTSYSYEAESEMEGSLSITLDDSPQAHEIELSSRVSQSYELSCLETHSKGTRFQQRLRWIAIAGKVPGQDFAFDTREPGEIGDKTFGPLYETLKGVIDKPLGVDVGLLGGAAYNQKARQELGSLGGLISPDDFLLILAHTFPPLPTPPTQKVGASWDSAQKVPLSTIGELEIKTTRTLKSAEGTSLRVELTMVPKVMPGPGNDQAPPGSLVARKARGIEVYRQEDGLLDEQTSELELEVKIVEGNLRIEGRVRLSTRIRRR